MSRRAGINDQKTDPRVEETNPRVTKSPGNSRKKKTRHRRKVKFADPVSHQRIYERPLSPNATISNSSQNHVNRSTLNDLEPPLSLVAQLDLAAKKLNARPSSKISVGGLDTELSNKSLGGKASKSTMSLKSTLIKELGKATKRDGM